MRKFYVVTAVMPWGSLRLEETGQPLRTDDPNLAGYMSVYTTREAAQACIRDAGPDAPVGQASILVFEAPTTDDQHGVQE